MGSHSAPGSGEQGGRVDGSEAEAAGRGSAAAQGADPRAPDSRPIDPYAIEPRGSVADGARARQGWIALAVWIAVRIAVGASLLVAGSSVSFTLARGSNPDAEPQGLVVLLAVVAGASAIASTICVVIARRVAGATASPFVATIPSLGASYVALVAIAVVHALLDETGESLAWLPVAVLFGAPLVLPAVLGACVAVAVVASGVRPGAAKGASRSTPRA